MPVRISKNRVSLENIPLNLAPEVDVASASTTNIGAATSNNVRITGTTTITAFDTVSAGVVRFVRFAGALTLTHNATSLILPGGANITTAAGDHALCMSLGSGNWVVSMYSRYAPIGTAATKNTTDNWDLSGSFALSGDISPPQIVADQNDYAPTGFATASTLRLSSDASRNITGLAGGADGLVKLIHNVGAQSIVLKDESASSVAANRFALNADITLATDQMAFLQYDATSSRWRVIFGVNNTAPTIQVFTATGTWTRPAGCRKICIRLSGGGGGGGANGGADGGGGGGGGGYSEKWLDVSAISSVAVTVGAGGAGGTGTGAGAAGGTSSFGTHNSATGGSGGAGGTAGAGGAGGAGTGGDINAAGQMGDSGSAAGAHGGSSLLGGGGTRQANGGAYGGGAGGSGAGAAGVVIVEEFY